jgi:hypothetical protein
MDKVDVASVWGCTPAKDRRRTFWGNCVAKLPGDARYDVASGIMDLCAFDRVTLSGYCVSEGRFLYRVAGTIGTFDSIFTNRDGQIKLWPSEPIGDGKLWFNVRSLRIHKHERTRYRYLRCVDGWDYFELPPTLYTRMPLEVRKHHG